MVVVGESELSKEKEQIHLGDPEFDVLAVRSWLPLQHLILLEIVVAFSGGVHAMSVDPSAEACGNRNVR